MGVALWALCAGLTARADYQSTVVGQGPVGYWRLDESIAPPTGTSAVNLGTLGAAADGAYTAYPSKGQPGVIAGNNAVAFDGLSQWLFTPYSTDLNPGAFTIEAWLRPATATPTGNLTCVLASMHSASPRAGWLIYQSGGAPDTSDPGWQFRMYGGNGSATSLRLLLTNNVVAGTWYHVVFTYDGATVKSYLNGEFQGQGTPDSFGLIPNADAPFSIGARSDTGFPWAGTADEVAYFGTALSAAQIKAHYDAAANPAGYQGTIVNDGPLAYYRLNEPIDPPAANLGTLGAAGNGFYVSASVPGQTGPRGAGFPGFPADNKAPAFDGLSGFVNLPPLKFKSDHVTMTAWVRPTTVESNNAAMVFCRVGSTTVAGLKFDVADENGLSYNWNNDLAASNFKSGLTVPANEWSFVALVVQPERATLCLGDSTGFNTVANDAPHAPQEFNGATRVGSDSSDANLTFIGQIDEVAIFDRTLGVGDVYTQWATAVGGKKPAVFADPTAPNGTVFAGDTLTLTVDAGGTAPLNYQWRRNGTAIPGATSSTYTKTNIQPGDGGNYDVLITNGSGSVTSAPAAITVEALFSPQIVDQPVGRKLYAAGSWTLKVNAVGGGLSYQWRKGQQDIPNATNSTYVLNPAKGEDTGDYVVKVSNRLGNVTSDQVNVTVIVPAAGSFEAAVVADAPEAWWRLDEANGATELLDAMGRHDGTYLNNYTLGVPGAVRGGNTALSLDADGYAEVPFSPALNTTDFAIECWAKTTQLSGNYSPMSTSFSGKGCFFYTRSGEWSGGVGQNATWYYVPSDTSGATIQADTWVHLVLTYSANSSLRVYVNGQWDGQGYVNFERNAAGPVRIGARGLTVNTVDYKFKGVVDEVAIYSHGMTTNQAMAHYIAGLFGNDTKPIFRQQPLSGAVLQGGSYTFSAAVEGSPTITLQWMHNGSPVDGATSSSLTIANATPADAGTYKLVATNPAGTTESNPATLAVLASPSACGLGGGDLVLHLRFDDDYKDTSGRNNNGTPQGSPTFVAGAIGTKALHYSTVTDDSGAVTEANYVSLGVPADLQFGTSQNFSISYWVRFSGLPGDLPFFCNAINSYSNDGYTFAPSYQRGGWSWSFGGLGIYGPDATINNNQWHHLVHTADRTGNVTTYLDGVRVDYRPAGSQNLDTGDPTNIGQDPTGSYPEPGGADIDDLAVWRRVLTPEEALCIYSVGKNLGQSFDTTAVNMTVSFDGTQLTVGWPSGTLQQADSVTGTWSNVPGAAAPTYKVSPTAAAKFYRVKL